MIFKRISEGAVDLDTGQHNHPSTLLNAKRQKECRFCAGMSVSKDENDDIGYHLLLLEHASKRISRMSDN